MLVLGACNILYSYYFGISWFHRIWPKTPGTTAPVPIEGSAFLKDRLLARSSPFLLWREAALTPDFQVQGAAFLRRRLPRRLGRTDARSESARTQRTPKNSGRTSSRSNSLELLLSFLKLLIAEIIGRQCLCRNHWVHHSGYIFTNMKCLQ